MSENASAFDAPDTSEAAAAASIDQEDRVNHAACPKAELSSSALSAELWYVDMNRNQKRDTVVSEAGPVRWNTVKKRLGTIAVVKTVIDSTKNTRVKKPFEQRDFLKKFSTRDQPVKANKRVSMFTAGRKMSMAVDNGRTHVPLIEETNQESANMLDKVEMQNIPSSERVIDVDESYESDVDDSNRLCNLCKYYMHATVEPYGNFLYFWLFLVITAIHYNAWMIPARIAFTDAQKQYETLWFVLDYIADVIYLLDILINLRMSFLENGIYIDNLSRLALTYIKSYQFGLDVLSLLPLDFLYLVFGIYPSLRVLRVLKYYKVFLSQKTILSLTNYPNIIRTFFFLHLMLIMMHWNACCYFVVSKYEGFGINQWVYPTLDANTSALIHQYVLCYYWSTLSLTTIGGSYHPVTTIE